MRNLSNLWAFALLACLSLASVTLAEVVHKTTYYSAPFELGGGDVMESYEPLQVPEGHIGVRNFFAEVVDEDGNSVPLYELYLHHWGVLKYMVRKGHKELVSSSPKVITDPTVVFNMRQGHAHRIQFQEGADVKQALREGTCSAAEDALFFGLGSESRKSDRSIPAPYALDFGNPDVPEGYEEAWYLNIHAIDTRGAVDITSCAECVCESYGVTVNAQGKSLEPGYVGGLHCCYDKTHCAVKVSQPKRALYMRYIVTWVQWDETVIPVTPYFVSATDLRTDFDVPPSCDIEYDVPLCDRESNNACVDLRHTTTGLPLGGDLILAALHQHVGAMGGIIYDKNGLVLCESMPIYGDGEEAGNEAGYVVGMTSCVPKPGSVQIATGEAINVDAFYSAEQARTGLMSVFTLHIAEPVLYIEKVTN